MYCLKMKQFLYTFACLIVLNGVVAPSQQPKHVKDYVKTSKLHVHPNPLLTDTPEHYSSRHVQNTEYKGQAEKYNRPSGPSAEPLLDPERRVDTTVECHKTHMTVAFEFSTPFNGFVYPHDHFSKCVLFSGQNSHHASLTLYHGVCGQKQIHNANDPDFSAIIEHRLMVQWERDFVCEDDSSVIVRCDRPDDFQKTIAWNFTTAELQSSFERNTHPGPEMWMEIQRGEGPSAPPLNSNPVLLGDVLTLVFGLHDDVFWFGSNILSCTAIEVGSNAEPTYEVDQHSPAALAGRMTVIENECSTKPKIFSHFFNERVTKDGRLLDLHYAHFKAFRFPSSQKVIIQCDLKVCYKNCEELRPCSSGFQPRSSASKRQRREVPKDSSQYEEGVELDTVLLYRTIEVYGREDAGIADIPLRASLASYGPSITATDTSDCFSARSFFAWIVAVGFVAVIFLLLFTWQLLKYKSNKEALKTPQKGT